MEIDFITGKGHNFLADFAKKLQVPLNGDRLILPVTMGEGNVRKISIEAGVHLIIHRYRLKEEFVLRRHAPENPEGLVTFIFHNNEDNFGMTTEGQDNIHVSKHNESAIQITSCNLNSVTRFPAKMDIYFTVVGIMTDKLVTMLPIQHPNELVQTITSGNTFLFYERMDRDTQKVLRQITEYTAGEDLDRLYYMYKIQELLYILFRKLLKRDAVPQQAVNKWDIEKLFVVRAAILADLSKPPVLAELSVLVGMGETKLKKLFKQVFGDSIYDHFQNARMEEAAFLLKSAGRSVSEAGYELGFSNLSHFSRLFEKHYGLTPKKYSSAG
ncbi:helix-turn-helix domain-containing protein [Flavitalea flava]